MANNKVQLSDGTVLLDLTGDTVTPETLVAGVTAHDAAGNRINGAVAPVRYDVAQDLTSEQQKQARDNIGAGDMQKSVYDPQGKHQDVFKYVNDTAAPNSQGTELIKGTQTSKTNLWTGISTSAALYDGKIIDYYLPYAGNGAAVTLTLTLADGTTTGAIPVKMRGTTFITTQYLAKSVIHMVYVANDNCWQCQTQYWENFYSSAVCFSSATEVNKTISFTNFTLKDNSWLQINMVNGNSAQSGITLKASGSTSKPIYINGSLSSPSNYKLPAGTYFVFYDGTAYYFQTDGYLYGTVPTNRTVNGHELADDVIVNKDDIGLSNVDNVKQYSADNPPPYPVTTNLIKGDGLGGLAEAAPETDYASPVTMRKVTLTAAGWNSSTKKQTVTVPGVLADTSKQVIWVTQTTEAAIDAYLEAGIVPVAQAANTVTLRADTVPTADITVNIVVQEVQ